MTRWRGCALAAALAIAACPGAPVGAADHARAIGAPGGPVIAQATRPLTPAETAVLEQLGQAARAGDVAAAERLLAPLAAAGQPIPAQRPERFTALHLAIMNETPGGLAVAERLLAHGAAIDARAAEDAWTPLYTAVARRLDERALWLLDRGARPDVPDKAGATALERALGERAPDGARRLELIRRLLAADAQAAQRRDARGRTLLHQAVPYHGPEVLEALLARGVDARVAASDGATALHALALRGARHQTELLPPADLARALDALLRAGAAIDARDAEGTTPLHAAAAAHSVPLLAALVERRADLQARDGRGRTALMLASDSEEVGRWLLDRGIDPRAHDAQGRSALHYASRDGSLGLMERLLTGGLPPGGGDSGGLTPLHFAAGPGGAVAGVRRLVEAGASVDARSACGLTPLHAAAIEGKEGIAVALLDRGADVNARTTADCRWIPLIFTSPAPGEQGVSLAAGATPLDAATQEHAQTKWSSGRHRKMMTLLEQRGGGRAQGGLLRGLQRLFGR